MANIPVSLGDVLEVLVDSQGPHGQGIARLDGDFIIFVQNVAPTKKIKVKITHVARTYADAIRVG